MGSSSLDYEVVYHIPVRDYDLYMDINEEINFKILELFEKEKVEIPYPTQTIYTRKD
jgi:MscS family membrane protein